MMHYSSYHLLPFKKLQVEAEEQPEISEAYSVSAVPYFVFLKVGGCYFILLSQISEDIIIQKSTIPHPEIMKFLQNQY